VAESARYGGRNGLLERQLAGIKPFKVLPDHARPVVPTTNGAIASRLLPRELTNRAQTLSAERGATLFATAFAALCAHCRGFTSERNRGGNPGVRTRFRSSSSR